MTDQYQKNSINAPRSAREVAVNTTLNFDDDFVVVDSTAAGVTLTLPLVQQIPAQRITIEALTGATNPVGIASAAGQTVNGGVSITLTVDRESVILVADPENLDWALVSHFNPDSGCCNPDVLLPIANMNGANYAPTIGGSTPFDIGVLNLTVAPTMSLRTFPGSVQAGTTPTIANIVFTAGSATALASLAFDLVVNGGGADGDEWALVLTAPCGCEGIGGRVRVTTPA